MRPRVAEGSGGVGIPGSQPLLLALFCCVFLGNAALTLV